MKNTLTAIFDSIPFSNTGILPSITLDYLTEPERLTSFFNRYFTREDFYRQILEKDQEFTTERREILVRALKRQYRDAGVELSDSNPPKIHIDLLAHEGTFTITTGHQLCLHTGPLYFFYKIISAIVQARRLKHFFPEYQFVPVYWMASEDHDFEEIHHFHHGGVRFQWNFPHQGEPVGRLPLNGYKGLLEAYSDFLKPHNSFAIEWITLLENSYLTSNNLAQATRKFVHQLFGQYGIVVLDGDDPELKRAFRFILHEEVIRQVSNKALKETSEEIGRLWFAQIHPREINFFYIGAQKRERIVKTTDGTYKAGDKTWSTNQLEQEIEKHPERFSPNVVTRPLYQEFVLPNMAYIGGANEIAYWLQLKGVFTTHQLPMPILLLRNSFVQLDYKVKKFLQKTGLSEEVLFRLPSVVAKEVVRNVSPTDVKFDNFSDQLKILYGEIEQYCDSVDKTLVASARARLVRHLKALESLRSKTLSAEVRNNEHIIEKLQGIRQRVYPNGVLQERYENLGQYYSKYGRDWVDFLVEHAKMPTTEAYLIYWPD